MQEEQNNRVAAGTLLAEGIDNGQQRAGFGAELAREAMSISDGIFEPIHTIGGGGGTPFSYYGGYDGRLLERIRVWAGPWQIKAIEVKLTGENSRIFGDPGNTPSKEYAFQPGERITQLSLWGNGAGSRTGAIRFATTLGNIFDFGMTEWGRKTEYRITALGDGICCGIVGSSGSDIDNMGFVFLTPVQQIRMKDVKYPTLTFDSQGITPERLDSYKHTNNSDVPYDWTFSGRRSVTAEDTWSVGATAKVYGEVSVEAGVPEVAKVGGKFGWEVSATTTHSSTESTTREISWSANGTLRPNESISLEAITRQGKLLIPYTAVMEVTLKSGQTFAWEAKGQYAGVSYSSVEVTSD